MRVSENARSRGFATPRRIAGLAFSIVVLSTVITARAPSPVVAIDLGTLGGSASYGYAANDSGTVVGYSVVAGNASYHAFAWTESGGMKDLGTLGGSNSSAWSVDEHGVVYGLSDHADSTLHVFSWTPATGTVDLGSLGNGSYVNAVSAKGTVVGYRFTGDDRAYYRAFVWTRRDGLTDLGTLAGGPFSFSNALAVNQAGVVVGWTSTPGGGLHAFRWDRIHGMLDLGAFGGADSSSYAAAVSDGGAIVGASSTAAVIPEARSHAFAWTRARGMVDLGTLGGENSWARTVNSKGLVAGVSYVHGSVSNAFAWTDDDGMTNIGTLGGGESDVTAVNDEGLVVGGSWTADNVAWRAFAWTRKAGIVELRPANGFSGNSYPAALTTNGLVAGASCSQTADGELCHAAVWNTFARHPHRR